MQCVIYKGAKKPDTYLYLALRDDFSCVPEPLLLIMGRLEYVMSLELDAGKKLACANAEEVCNLLREQGYYLQLPPLQGGKRPLQYH